MTDDTIHTCSYYCERPECVRRQRDELRDRMESALAQQQRQAVALPKLKQAHPNYSREEVQWVFGYNAALDDVMRLNQNTALSQQPAAVDEAKETDLWRCTVCGRVGTVGRCCGEETREPLAPPSALVGVDFAAVASILRRAMRDGVHYGYRRDFILQQALALEALSQQPAEEGERDWLMEAMDTLAEWRFDALKQEGV